MKVKILVIMVLCFVSLENFSQNVTDFRETYDLEYFDALKWTKGNKLLINNTLENKKASFVLAIAFPELVRYETWKNVIEMYSLEMSYIKSGTKMVDFSVGFFQIKPSFVEYLESQSEKYTLSKKENNYLKINNLSIENQRKTRLQRLKTAKGQLQYLQIFYQMASQKYASHLSKLSTSKQLEFLATAYNLGLQHDAKMISKYQLNKYFPYGKKYKGTQYSYGKISVDFYDNYAKKLLN